MTTTTATTVTVNKTNRALSSWENCENWGNMMMMGKQRHKITCRVQTKNGENGKLN